MLAYCQMAAGGSSISLASSVVPRRDKCKLRLKSGELELNMFTVVLAITMPRQADSGKDNDHQIHQSHLSTLECPRITPGGVFGNI